MYVNLIWFRNDLRTLENPAVSAACQNNTFKVIAIYIATPNQWRSHHMAPKQAAFIYHNLISLKNELVHFDIKLYTHQSSTFLNAALYFIKFCLKHDVKNVFYNYEYMLNECERDNLVKKHLHRKKIFMYGFHGSMLLSPHVVKNKKNKTYQVYSPFKKCVLKHLKQLNLASPMLLKKNIKYKKMLTIRPFCYPMEEFDQTIFPIGEKRALYRLKIFCTNKIIRYGLHRNFPYLTSTSLLSPYLSIGVLSPIQCLKYILKKVPNVFSLSKKCTWLNEIIWREFYYYLIASYPILSKNQSIKKWTEKIPWKNNNIYLEAWKKGNTGFPIIDAGMRQLNTLGWMHNRLRMITASFLVKNLFIDWRLGHNYFMSKLIDGNFASNNGNWQWISSTGYNSTPYFRIFNPEIQSKKFDCLGKFILQYIPELKKIPISEIHNPHAWIIKNKVNFNYPAPIINYKLSRKNNLSVFIKTYNIHYK
ncbi:deoxyribodipyrimidine photolyase [Buchnera aphidicola (Nipponaphis monzeni)]|uniref:Deoxyribodipyrimidine photo-lyase n=1 Tax=Buchnera aphidicola (Nipponaphis monzeni) TaxID=2495405 RepID=A0A455TA81_9GAMM|nr:deoxyribodipyrimidine photo-lyase [Buchnera aphidicola]BBI01244.1 deoxyribodipyrimidine photolyase [Buchnera aphidicola (Nipponaphis monzeni)]